MKSFSKAYQEAGVDITAGYRAVELMKQYVARTMTEYVMSGLGGFGGMVALPKGYEEPILVSGTDGVGTKLKLSFLLERYDTVGIDCVAMCVNDVICCGAKPLFFLDYIACGKNVPERIADLVKGVSEGCVQSEAALIGGETAEMPGFYPEDEYDLAGFAVGIVDKRDLIRQEEMREGDVLLALPSSGVHSNGFSLIRKIFRLDELKKEEVLQPLAALQGASLGETLLEPTKIYIKPVLNLLREFRVHGLCHVTGGGFYENIPRMIPDGLCAEIDQGDVRSLPIFALIQETGKIETRDMFNTFNMGVGMVVSVAEEDAVRAQMLLREQGVDAYILGRLKKGTEKIELQLH